LEFRPVETPVVQSIPLREYMTLLVEDMAKNLSFPYDTEFHELLVVPVVTFDHIFPSKEYMTLLVVPYFETATNFPLPYVTEDHVSTKAFPVDQFIEFVE
jgi:hypothetical protein